MPDEARGAGEVSCAEAEGRVVGLSDIATETGLLPVIVERWVKVLSDRGIVEPCALARRNVQLTQAGMSKMEAILSSAYEMPVSR